MRILIVGNDPSEIGGVANYTRPLAIHLSELGNEVFYLYSGCWNRRYNLLYRPYLKKAKNEFPFECMEVINSPNFPNNYEEPEIDIESPQIEKLLSGYIDKIKPDVMHIHSRMGFPFSINRIAYERGVKVFNTIHVYGYICQRRVMIYRNGDVCTGPKDMLKCGMCTIGQRSSGNNILRLYYTFPKLFDKLVEAKKKLKEKEVSDTLAVASNSNDNNMDPGVESLAQRLGERLSKGVETLNKYVHKTICVSDDVKKTLASYGVDDSRLMVQHIGSTIAEKQTDNVQRKLHDHLVIGNIGGVGHYKGTHILIEAIKKIKTENKFVLKIFGKYDEGYVRELMKGNEGLPIEFTGRYVPDELPEILKQIDIMVLPSICNDTAPQTIFESFSGGVPIVASNIGGFPDFITESENGYLFRPGDSSDLAEKLSLVLNSPEIIEKFQKNIPRLKTIKENSTELISLYSSYL